MCIERQQSYHYTIINTRKPHATPVPVNNSFYSLLLAIYRECIVVICWHNQRFFHMARNLLFKPSIDRGTQLLHTDRDTVASEQQTLLSCDRPINENAEDIIYYFTIYYIRPISSSSPNVSQAMTRVVKSTT